MKVLVTGSGGLVGSEAVQFYCEGNNEVVGIDNNQRKYFFGDDGSVQNKIYMLKNTHENYKHYAIDIANVVEMEKIFKEYKF